MNTLVVAFIFGDMLLILAMIRVYAHFMSKKEVHRTRGKRTHEGDLFKELGKQQLEKLHKYNISLPISAI